MNITQDISISWRCRQLKSVPQLGAASSQFEPLTQDLNHDEQDHICRCYPRHFRVAWW